MYASAMTLRGIGLGGRFAVAACAIYIGSIFLVAAEANTASSDRTIEAANGICAVSQDDTGQPWQNDSDFPDSTTDIDDTDDVTLDLTADDWRTDPDMPHLFVIDLEAITLRLPEIIRTRRASVRCFYCLYEHIRERAPPSLNS
jgi:hypothetical protein